MVVDVALVNTYEVGKDVKVVRIVVAAINVSLARSQVTACAPHLSECVMECVLTNTVDGVPKSALEVCALAYSVVNHFVEVSCSS